MRRESGESGQATVELVGLVAVMGLVLAALVSGASGALGGGAAEERGGEARGGAGGTLGGGAAEARGLGATLADRITGAARDLCGAEALGARVGGSAAPDLRLPPPPKRPPGARPFTVFERPRVRRGPRSPASLRQLGALADRAWVVCFGYRSLRYELDHPRSPKEPMPTRHALEILNDRLNPWQFFFG
jgi:hypothetical protein